MAQFTPKSTAVLLRNCHDLPAAMQAGMPNLMALQHAHTPEKIHALIAAHLIELSAMLNLNKPLNEMQIDFVAGEVLSKYWHFSVADIYIIMRRAKSGYYGEYYESINPPKILSWFAEYENERTQFCIEFRTIEADGQRWRPTSRTLKRYNCQDVAKK